MINIKKIKYLFIPYEINRYKNLFLRKRWFHKGYSLLTVGNICNEYIHIRDFKNYDDASKFILDVYNVNIETM